LDKRGRQNRREHMLLGLVVDDRTLVFRALQSFELSPDTIVSQSDLKTAKK
jgi:hypothetical protein